MFDELEFKKNLLEKGLIDKNIDDILTNELILNKKETYISLLIKRGFLDNRVIKSDIFKPYFLYKKELLDLQKEYEFIILEYTNDSKIKIGVKDKLGNEKIQRISNMIKKEVIEMIVTFEEFDNVFDNIKYECKNIDYYKLNIFELQKNKNELRNKIKIMIKDFIYDSINKNVTNIYFEKINNTYWFSQRVKNEIKRLITITDLIFNEIKEELKDKNNENMSFHLNDFDYDIDYNIHISSMSEDLIHLEIIFPENKNKKIKDLFYINKDKESKINEELVKIRVEKIKKIITLTNISNKIQMIIKKDYNENPNIYYLNSIDKINSMIVEFNKKNKYITNYVKQFEYNNKDELKILIDKFKNEYVSLLSITNFDEKEYFLDLLKMCKQGSSLLLTVGNSSIDQTLEDLLYSTNQDLENEKIKLISNYLSFILFVDKIDLLCDCKKELTNEEKEKIYTKENVYIDKYINKDLTLYKKNGCIKCNYTGIKKQEYIFDFLKIKDNIKTNELYTLLKNKENLKQKNEYVDFYNKIFDLLYFVSIGDLDIYDLINILEKEDLI